MRKLVTTPESTSRCDVAIHDIGLVQILFNISFGGMNLFSCGFARASQFDASLVSWVPRSNACER
jgi:hypothetical protein